LLLTFRPDLGGGPPPARPASAALRYFFSGHRLAIAKEQSERRYRDAARYDFLTGVGSRRDFKDNPHLHFRRAQMSAAPLSLIMVDADGFKAYNDPHGHRAGDQCLRFLARTLERCCRPTDLLGRHGGEEFAVLVHDTDGELALALVESMRQAVYERGIKHAGRPAPLA
jgi:diguanylate cyclase (GGDEF)-like protein